MSALSADHRAQRLITEVFDHLCDRAPGRDVSVTRAELAKTAGAPEAWLVPAAEALARAGYLVRRKSGRVNYARGPEQITARPKLPQGWYWEHDPRVRPGAFAETCAVTGEWGPHGGPVVLTFVEIGPSTVGAKLAHHLGSEAVFMLCGGRYGGRPTPQELAAWRHRRVGILQRAAAAGVPSDSEGRLVAWTAMPDACLRLAKHTRDLAYAERDRR